MLDEPCRTITLFFVAFCFLLFSIVLALVAYFPSLLATPVPPPPTITMNIFRYAPARRLFAATVASLCLISAAVAQTARTPSTPETQDDALRMIPFEVSTANPPGPYIQDSAVSVTKFAVPLIDLPQNIFVFNREMLNDMNVGEMRYALAYNASLQGGAYSIGASYRGFSNQEKLRDGFKMSAFLDYPPIHFESIELLKGPSAVIYGRTEPGGITNYVSKLPVPGRNFAVFNIGIGDNNGNLRENYSFDINTSLSVAGGTPLDLRLTGAAQRFEDFISGSTANGQQPQNSIRLAATYWLTDTTRLYLSYLFYERSYGSQFGRYASFGVGVPQATPGHTIPFSIVYNRDPFEDYGWGRKFFWQYNDTTAILDQKISSTMDFRAGFSLHKRSNGDRLIGLAATTLAGQGALRQTNINFNRNDLFIPDTQAHLIWKPVANQNILFGYSRNWTYSDLKQWFQQRNADGTPFGRTYNPAISIPRSLPLDVVYLPTGWERETIDFQSLIVNYHGGFFNNKLHLMAGVARNSVDVEDRTAHFRARRADFKTSDTNPQLGAIYKLTPAWSVFALASQASQFNQSTRDSFGNSFGPITGDGIEGGLKFTMNNGRVNGTLTYYNTTQANNIVFDPLARSFSYEQTVAAGTPNPALLGDNVAGGTTGADGIEFDLNAEIMPGWSLTFSAASSDQRFKKNPNPRIQGTRLTGLEPIRVAAFSRYSFERGPAKGLFVGGGAIYVNKIFGGFSPGSNQTKNFWRDAQFRLDVFTGYKFRAFGRENSIKISGFGINEPKVLTSGFDPAVNKPYTLKASAIWYLDYQVRF